MGLTQNSRSFDAAAETITSKLLGGTKKAVPKSAAQAREVAAAISAQPREVKTPGKPAKVSVSAEMQELKEWARRVVDSPIGDRILSPIAFTCLREARNSLVLNAELMQRVRKIRQEFGERYQAGMDTMQSLVAAKAGDVSQETPAAEVMLKLKSLVRHPDNRHPDPADVASRAESLNERGQLEAIVVRPVAGGKYEVLSGETRWLGAAKLKWSEIRAIVRPCDDATALILLAEYNAQRADLNPIEKAKLIKRLCEPKSAGGAGLTRDQAAKKYKLENGASATNLVRLLELPQWWQDRVAGDKLSQRHAREVLPYLASAPLMRELQAKAEQPTTVEAWQRVVNQSAANHARPMTTSYYDARLGWRECHFKPTGEQREQLQIVKLKDYDETHEWALNIDLWEQLNAPAERKAKEAKAKREEKLAAKRGNSTSPAAAESSAKDKEEQFAKRLYRWRVDWLRYLVACDFLGELDNEELLTPALHRMLLWLSVSRGGEDGDSFTTMNMLHGNRGEVLSSLCGESRNGAWAKLTQLDAVRLEQLLPMYAARLLYSTTKGPLSLVPAEVVEGLALQLQVDLLEAWQKDLAGPLTDAYFELHTKDQLVALAAELGVSLAAGSKPQLIAQIKTQAATKKRLPAEIKAAKAPKR